MKTNLCSILKFCPVSLGHVECRIVLAIIEIVITLAQVENSIKGLKIPFLRPYRAFILSVNVHITHKIIPYEHHIVRVI